MTTTERKYIQKLEELNELWKFYADDILSEDYLRIKRLESELSSLKAEIEQPEPVPVSAEMILDRNGFDFEAFKFENEYSAKNLLLAMEEYHEAKMLEELYAFAKWITEPGHIHVYRFEVDGYLKEKANDNKAD